MARPNVVINGTTYNSVPSVQIPLSGGGTATFYSTDDADVQQNTMLNGTVAYGASGRVVGNLTVPTVTQDGSSKVLTIS